MFPKWFCAFSILASVFCCCQSQQYDFAAEISRQCLVPDPVGLLDCVENKVTLPYLTSWVDCTNSLGQNVRTSADIINYRCKSVWEGKGVIPEVFFIKDCVIEKTGLPAKNVSAEVLGAYKECESSPQPQQQRIKGAPVQQQRLQTSSVQYQPQTQQFQAQQFQPPAVRPPVVQPPMQNFQAPVVKAPPQPMIPFQQVQAPVSYQPQNVAPRQQLFQAPVPRPFQPQLPAAKQSPVQQQIQVAAPRPIQQAPTPRTFAPIQQAPMQQQQVPVALATPDVPRPQFQPTNGGPQYPIGQSPQSQQFFVIYPQAPFPNQQQMANAPILSQKTSHPAFAPQQQILASAPQMSSVNPNVPYSYSFQISHPLRSAILPNRNS